MVAVVPMYVRMPELDGWRRRARLTVAGVYRHGSLAKHSQNVRGRLTLAVHSSAEGE